MCLPFSVSQSGVLHTATSLPGLVVQYSADGGATWQDATDGATVPYEQKILLRTRYREDPDKYSKVIK